MHSAHACTTCLRRLQTLSRLSFPPDQSSPLPFDLQRRHSFPTTGEGACELRHGGKTSHLESCKFEKGCVLGGMFPLNRAKLAPLRNPQNESGLFIFSSPTEDTVSLFLRSSHFFSHLASLGNIAARGGGGDKRTLEKLESAHKAPSSPGLVDACFASHLCRGSKGEVKSKTSVDEVLYLRWCLYLSPRPSLSSPLCSLILSLSSVR